MLIVLEVVLITSVILSCSEIGSHQQHLNEKENSDLLQDKKDEPIEENPGALLQAFAEIKTSGLGETYGVGYKTRALDKARKRLASLKIKQEDLPWVSRGPANVMGRIRTVVVDPSDPSENTWFAASIGGGVWKSTDAGQSWTDKTPDLSTLTTTTMAIANSNPQVIYVGTGMGYGRIVDMVGSGVWKSTDGGETWTQLESTANGELLDAINRIVVDPNDENIVLVCSNGHTSHLGPKSTVNGPYGRDRKSGIFRSTDGGASWTQVFDPDVAIGTSTDNRVQQIIADPTNFQIMYASVNEVGVVKSTDGGVTWTVVANSFFDPSVIGVPGGNGFGLEGVSGRSELAVAPSNPQRIYASVERPQGQASDLMMSPDGGATWAEIIDTGSDPNWFEENGGLTRNAGWFDNTITVHPFNEDVVFVGGVNLYHLEIDPGNRTRTTTPISWWLANDDGISPLHADHHWLVPIKLNEAEQTFSLLNANDGGLGVSSDGGNTWTQIGNSRFGSQDLDQTPYGMITTQFYSIDKKPGENVYIGGLQDAHSFVSGTDPDLTTPWRSVHGGDGIEAVWHHTNPQLVMASSQATNLWKSTDGGLNFLPVSGEKTGPTTFLTKVAHSKSDPDLLFTIDINGVNRSDDFGETWTSTAVNNNWIGYRPFSNVEISLADPRVVWITSRLDPDPANGAVGGIHVSTDGGLTFLDRSPKFPTGTTESSGLATHPSDPNTAYFLFSVPGSPKILKTTDLGETFEDISGFSTPTSRFNDIGFPDVAVYSLLVMPHDDNILWAGTEIGLVISNDGGVSWQLADNGLPNVGIFQMSIVDGQILVATQGRGVWTLELPELADHVPPVVTLSPRVKNARMSPTNEFIVDLDFRSAYDNVQLLVDGVTENDFGAISSPGTDQFTMVPVTEEEITVQLVATKDGNEYKSAPQTLFVFPAEARDSYFTTFDGFEDAADFFGIGFQFTNGVTGFSTGALHSDHPYSTGIESIYQLQVPIIVDESVATLRYKDVVLVEPGTADIFTDLEFFDFVILEGSNDGVNWQPLADGYDSRSNETWLSTYNSNPNAVGDESMYVTHFIDLLETFSPGEKIFIRFRIFSDPAVVGWGWAIDNLIIQNEQILTAPEIKAKTRLSIYPNPVENLATIQYDSREASHSSISIHDVEGKMVRFIENPGEGGQLTIDTQGLRSGIYFINLIADSRLIDHIRFIKK